MPRMRLNTSTIDALPIPQSVLVYWDGRLPSFGVKVIPQGRKVFIMLYRTGGAGSKLRKYTIGPYGRVTLHQARAVAQRGFAAKNEGRDLAAEMREPKRRSVADRDDDLLEQFVEQRLSQNRSGKEITRRLRRGIGKPWAIGVFTRSINVTWSSHATTAAIKHNNARERGWPGHSPFSGLNGSILDWPRT